MKNNLPKLLLAEDDLNLGLLLQEYLQASDFHVTLCRNGKEASERLHNETFDLLLFDVMMPEKDGFTLAKEVRTKDKKTPIIFITAKSLKVDKLIGYQVGADDYITKPFDEDELVWKIKALLRRTENKDLSGTIELGQYTFIPTNQELIFNHQVRRITERECEILSFLFQHKNRVVKREDLLMTIWGENDYFLGRSLDVFISKIRKYLKDDSELSIENVFGVGFIFKLPSQS
ncbi:MAG: DNA-binding response OmpR family regulator [Vicingaceae bacterium]|jgi:DNA-binding response OmpR family regulator